MSKSLTGTHQFETESELYKLIIETANEGVWLVDENNNTTYVNQKMADMLGYSVGEIKEKSMFFCMDDAGIEQAKKGLTDRKKGHSSSHNFRLIRKDGTELWTHMNVSPIGIDGKYKGALAMVTDITELREKAIIQKENYQTYASLFEESPIPLWEEDFSEIKKHIDQLRSDGVTDFREFFENNPDELVECVSKLIVNNINQAVVELNEAESKEEVLGSFRSLLNKRSAEYAIIQLEAIANRQTKCEFDAEFKTLNGNTRYVHFKWSVVKGYENDYGKVYLSTTDLTERIVAENISLQNANRQKETLLREIHHRVKNNLQIISSLLNLQMNNVDDPEIQDVLSVGLNRVKSMAAVHEMLYRSEDFAGIDYSAYLNNFVRTLVESFKGKENNIDLQIDARDIVLNLNTSIPLGLMINEIVTNSLKHGIPDDKEGRISVSIRCVEYPKFLLEIGDSGPGIKPDQRESFRDTLGMQLIEGLADQLNGAVEILDDGSIYVIEFEELEMRSTEDS